MTGPEILFGQVITQFMVMTGQTIMVLIFTFAVFKLTCEGNIGWVSLLTILTGLCGMCFGIYILYIHLRLKRIYIYFLIHFFTINLT